MDKYGKSLQSLRPEDYLKALTHTHTHCLPLRLTTTSGPMQHVFRLSGNDLLASQSSLLGGPGMYLRHQKLGNCRAFQRS